jgi:hypothetical protein
VINGHWRFLLFFFILPEEGQAEEGLVIFNILLKDRSRSCSPIQFPRQICRCYFCPLGRTGRAGGDRDKALPGRPGSKASDAGGPVKWNVTAADIMADQAKFLGVPEKDIVLEKWAISTYENSFYSLMAPGPGNRSGGPGYPYVISMPPGCRRQGILGRAVRDYIHVDDLAAAHVLALEALEQGSPTAAYNLGSGRGYSVLEVIKAAEKVTGQKVPYRVGPRRPGGAGSLGRKSHGGVRLAAGIYRTGGHHCYCLALAPPQAAGI